MELTFKDKKPFLFKYFPGLTFSVIQKKKRNFQSFYNISSLSDEMDNIISESILM